MVIIWEENFFYFKYIILRILIFNIRERIEDNFFNSIKKYVVLLLLFFREYKIVLILKF